MRRVKTIYALRLLSSPLVLAPVLFLVSLWGVGREVWVARILENLSMVHSPEAISTFAFMAFLNTGIAVQALTVAVALSSIWFMYGIRGSFESRRQLAW